MFEKLKKHSVKIFVFTINILLAAIAVLIIREKDQARLLENTQKEILANENAQSSSALPSFENSVSSGGVQSDSPPANVSKPSPPADTSTAVPVTPAPSPAPISVPKPAPVPVPAAISAPATVQNANPSNARTKTS
ncbi:MAG: hypothetical protein NT170_00410 [Candidatus Moranbacteria bacterium]|nr:hypothetical protein [Candidatus Moranbacteria bacterium]